MAHLLSDFVAYFTLDEINIDNWVFKLYYKVSTILCMLGNKIPLSFIAQYPPRLQEQVLELLSLTLENQSLVSSPGMLIKILQMTTVGCMGVLTFLLNIRCIINNIITKEITFVHFCRSTWDVLWSKEMMIKYWQKNTILRHSIINGSPLSLPFR